MENSTATSNWNCLNVLNYRSILKQTVGKYIHNYHILEHIQWQHCENSEQNYLCCSSISTICLTLQKNLNEVYECMFLKQKETEAAIMKQHFFH